MQFLLNVKYHHFRDYVSMDKIHLFPIHTRSTGRHYDKTNNKRNPSAT